MKATDWKAWREAQERRGPKINEWDLAPVDLAKRSKIRFQKQLAKQTKDFARSGTFLWTMFLKDSGEFVGWIDISTIARERHQMANLGWFTLNTYRGNGYAKEAVLKLISAAFNDLAFHRLEASIDPRNKTSIAMARACGLKREGIKKYYLRDDDGTWRDQVIYMTTPELFYDK